MINVLINAYAVNPNWGSEPGMGWNWIVNLAKYCNLHVITEGEWKDNIEEAVAKLPYKENLHFYYNPLPEKVRKMCWNQGDWRFYWYYRKWQKKTLEMAKEIIANNQIDVLHQLNMIGFREPGYLWKIKDVPFVWGPVGGMELMPVNYLAGAPFKQKVVTLVKNLLNRIQTRYSYRVVKAINNADAMIAAVKGVSDCVKKYHHRDIVTINETGCYPKDGLNRIVQSADNDFNILWVGKFDFRKQLMLALRTVANIGKNSDIKLHIAGTGTEAEVEHYRKMAENLGISDKCVWHGMIPHDKVQNLMMTCDLLLFTSIMEGTPHVVLEAIGNRLPVVCFDTCGQAASVNDRVGIKVPLSTIEQSVQDFSKAIVTCYENRDVLKEMSNASVQRQEELSWDNKALQVWDIYKKVVEKSNTL